MSFKPKVLDFPSRFQFVYVISATCFLEFWKRKQAELEYDWDVMDFELEEVGTITATTAHTTIASLLR